MATLLLNWQLVEKIFRLLIELLPAILRLLRELNEDPD